MKLHPLFILILIVFYFFSVTPSFGQQLKYSKVKIHTDANGLKKLAEKGVSIDHGESKQHVYFISDFSETEIKIIQQNGYSYEILIDDVSKYYATQNDSPDNQPEYIGTLPCKPTVKVPSHFHLGSYAGFFEYTEMLEILDSMQLLYPTLISKKAAIDSTKTSGGRPLYWLRISNKPNESQPGKVQVFYNALHHAREPGSISQIIYFMWYLLDNYETDKEVKGLVDNLELYFVPCVNPDGYVANQKSNPNGGGMKRTNGRGVDINRNYDIKWGYDNSGSSPDPGSDTYRGPSAGSEAETKMIKKFCINHNFALAMSCHTYGGLLIFPWGYKSNFFTTDNKTFQGYAKFMVQNNKYAMGTPNQTVGYLTNGSSDDWFYGEQQLKNKIFEFTPEAGSSFYPAKKEIIPFCKEVLDMNIKMAKLALKYVIASDADPYFITGKSGFFHYTFKSMVPDSMADFTIRILPISPEIINVGNPKTYKSVATDKQVTDSISFELAPGIPNGTPLKYVLTVSNGKFTHSDTLEKISGVTKIAFVENGNSINNWISSGWNVTSTIFHSASSSITDSPTGKYENNKTATITSKNSIDLSDATYATASFWAKWEIERNFDYAQIQASADSGQTWTPLCGNYSISGSKHQDFNQPVYDDAMDWVREEINLRDFAGKKVWFRFVLKTDMQNVFDGFYFDDFMVTKIDSKTIGINEYEASPLQVLNCIPNPADNYIYINYQITAPVPSPLTLFINNLSGQTVYSKTIDNPDGGSVLVNTSVLSNGVYMCHLVSGTYRSLAKRICIVH